VKPYPSWSGFQNGNGEEFGSDIEKLIALAKNYIIAKEQKKQKPNHKRVFFRKEVRHKQ